MTHGIQPGKMTYKVLNNARSFLLVSNYFQPDKLKINSFERSSMNVWNIKIVNKAKSHCEMCMLCIMNYDNGLRRGLSRNIHYTRTLWNTLMTHGIQVPTKYTKMTYKIMIMRAVVYSFQFLDTNRSTISIWKKKKNLTLHIMWGKQQNVNGSCRYIMISVGLKSISLVTVELFWSRKEVCKLSHPWVSLTASFTVDRKRSTFFVIFN